MPEDLYLVRYGSMAHVGRFHFSDETGNGGVLERGAAVVIRTERGAELGEVLARHWETHNSLTDNALDQDQIVSGEQHAVILRRATGADEAGARAAQALQVSRFAECERILREADWPGELIEVEMLLDGGTAVLHYVAFEEFDAGVLRARFRVMCDLDVVMERVGGDLVAAEVEPGSDPDASGGCSSGGCSTGGGCSSGGGVKRAARTAAGGRAAISDRTA